MSRGTGSSEEQSDLCAAYVRHEGEMAVVLAELKCGQLVDAERHCSTVESLIVAGQLRRYKRFTRSAKQLRRQANYALHVYTFMLTFHVFNFQ